MIITISQINCSFIFASECNSRPLQLLTNVSWVEFVVGSCLVPRDISWVIWFSLFPKTNISKFKFNPESGGHTLVKQCQFICH